MSVSNFSAYCIWFRVSEFGMVQQETAQRNQQVVQSQAFIPTTTTYKLGCFKLTIAYNYTANVYTQTTDLLLFSDVVITHENV